MALIALSGVTLAAAAASATLSINAALALGSVSSMNRSLLGMHAALSGVTLAAAAASATLSIEAALALSRKLGRLGPLAARRVHRCGADRPVGCDARHRSCVSYTLDQRCCTRSRKLEQHRPLAARRVHR